MNKLELVLVILNCLISILYFSLILMIFTKDSFKKSLKNLFFKRHLKLIHSDDKIWPTKRSNIILKKVD